MACRNCKLSPETISARRELLFRASCAREAGFSVSYVDRDFRCASNTSFPLLYDCCFGLGDGCVSRFSPVKCSFPVARSYDHATTVALSLCLRFPFQPPYTTVYEDFRQEARRINRRRSLNFQWIVLAASSVPALLEPFQNLTINVSPACISPRVSVRFRSRLERLAFLFLRKSN